MKHLTSLIIAVFTALALTTTGLAQIGGTQKPQAPNVKFQGSNNEVPAGAVLRLNGDIQAGTGSSTTSLGVPFVRTATITSAAAATAVNILPDAAVGSTRKVYVTGVFARVNGATLWATTATVKVQDTNSSAVDFVTYAVAALTANTSVFTHTSNVTLESAYLLGTGGTLGKGLQLKGNANGTGSPLVVTVTGYIK